MIAADMVAARALRDFESKNGSVRLYFSYPRPVRGSRGFYRVNMRHGVSRIRFGHRHTLGVIFHDAA